MYNKTMDKTVIFMMGKSGCGKSTTERRLVETWPQDYKKVVSVATRSMREGETDGKDYYFISEKEYFKMRDESYDLVQVTSFAGNYYGSTVSEYTTEHRFPILVAVPESVASFTPILKERFPDIKTYNIYFDISDDRLRANMKVRGDTDKMITERLAADTLDDQFRQSCLEADFVVTDKFLNPDLHNLIHFHLMSEPL